MLRERVLEWTHEWEQQGWVKGIEQGLEQGLEKEKSAVDSTDRTSIWSSGC